MTVEELRAKLPGRLQQFVVDQYYERYTAEDQAVWRYILRQLHHFLSVHGHDAYTEGLKKTGISVEVIPRIEDVSDKMQEFGWLALPVSGFIPPAAFMEFQALGYLPIASDMRTLEHIFYTPAPDIVHEAAGHAPIIADPDYAEYLRNYADVAKHAILSHEDLALYEAIRELSDIKENPQSTPEEIAACEKRLDEVSRSMSFVSEAAQLGRMNWWTAEYGLMGDMAQPKVFGAGLLSSVGECRSFLDENVKKIPLSLDCVDYSYDITEPQPQLFVAKDCRHLESVLEDLAETMAFRQGGLVGLDKAVQAKTVNTVELSSGLQISGKLSEVITVDEQPAYLAFSGPCQLSQDRKQLSGHGPEFHHSGYGTALGKLRDFDNPLENWSADDFENAGWRSGQKLELEFVSGVRVSGTLMSLLRSEAEDPTPAKSLLLTFDQCTVTHGERVLFQPEWGIYDLALGMSVSSVYGGPADVGNYPNSESFAVKIIPLREFSNEEKTLYGIYREIRQLRENWAEKTSLSESEAQKLDTEASQLHQKLSVFSAQWLPRLELLETLRKKNASTDLPAQLEKELAQLAQNSPAAQDQIRMGLEVIDDLPLVFS